MHEIQISPRVTNAALPSPVRAVDSVASSVTQTEARDGDVASFAEVLKSTSEKGLAQSGKRAQSNDNLPLTTSDAVEPDPALAATAFLAILQADKSSKLPAASPPPGWLPTQAVDSATVSVVPLDTVDTVDAVDATNSAKPLVVGAAEVPGNTHADGDDIKQEAAPIPIDTPNSTSLPILVAASLSPATVAQSAQTSPTGRTSTRDNYQTKLLPNPSGQQELGNTKVKIAVEAAITADSGRRDVNAHLQDQNSGGFRGAMERAPQNSSLFVMQSGTALNPANPMAPSSNLQLETPLGNPGWRDELGQKISWMASNSRQQADLVLNPPQLGRIEISLTLDGDRVSASFISPHAAVREALESSLIRLREVLADAGVTLGQTHVGADSRNDSNPMLSNDDPRSFSRGKGERLPMSDANGNAPTAKSFGGKGMVDVFA